MQIRQAKIEDCRAIAQVQVNSYRTAYANIFPPAYLAHFTYEEQEQDWRAWMNNPGNEMLLVAETTSGEIVGYALGRILDNRAYAGELVALHVRRANQHQGIGSQLIAATAGELRQCGCASLMLQTLAQNPSRSLYEKLGGQLVDEQPWVNNAEFGVNVTEVTYGWSDIAVLCRNARNRDEQQ
ncbi:MAG: GNAT family N-acetyltransferase [Anaerolineales bacterium]|nr:GNAT family N-acetyltransferase [Anaerolineales bacterium]